jgi:DNA (cytosine-5)-methyltransferase 1
VSLTVFDAFCGAGGSSLGASSIPGVDVVMAANHWQKAIDVHQVNFPETRHDCADLSAVDFRRYLPCDIFIASPECTNHSASRGVSRSKQNVSLFDSPDPAADRSRATMWDVHRYIETHRPQAVVVENVTDAAGWIYFPTWLQCFRDAGYTPRILSINSMHVPGEVPQSRDRIYVVALRDGLKVDLDLCPEAWCPTCEKVVESRQQFKNAARSIGRYKQSWLYRCSKCDGIVDPPAAGAWRAIDWALPSTRIADRKKPLADATLRRIRIGLERYGIAVVQGSGHTFERASSGYARVWDAKGPLPTQTGDIQHGVTFIDTQRAHQWARPADEPFRAVEASTTHEAVVHVPFIEHLRTNHVAKSADEPFEVMTTGHGGAHGVVGVPLLIHGNDYAGPDNSHVRGVDRPMRTVVTESRPWLVTPMVVETAHAGERAPNSVTEPFRTMTASDDRPLIVDVPDSFYVRNFAGNSGDSMVHPITKPLGSVTTKGQDSLLVPYYSSQGSIAKPVSEPAGTMTGRDRYAVVEARVALDDCLFRMLEPHEVGRAMAFPDSYLVEGTKKDRVKLYGNAVTPPVMRWIIGRIAEALAA